VCDVAPEATRIATQVYLRGTGAIWVDDMHLDVVGKDVPTNDDHRWRSWTMWPAKYTTILDPSVKRNGHGTIRVTSDSAVLGDWNTYDHTIEDADMAALRGHRIKFSAMIKSKGVAITAGPLIRLVGPDNSTAKRDEMFNRRPIRGTKDWTQ